MENLEELETMLVEQARRISDLTSEPELNSELKKTELLVKIYETIRKGEKLI